MNREIWKDVKGYEGLYQVSNFGEIKHLPYDFRNISGTHHIHESNDKTLLESLLRLLRRPACRV